MPKLQAVCAVCFNTHKLYKNGNLVRHGFQIHDRRVGEYGNAWHTGPCAGVRFPHFGASTEGTAWALEQVRAHLATLQAQLTKLQARPALEWIPGQFEMRKGLKALIIQPGAEADHCAKFADHVADWSGNAHATFRRPGYDSVLDDRLSKTKAAISLAKRDIEMYESAIANWDWLRLFVHLLPVIEFHQLS